MQAVGCERLITVLKNADLHSFPMMDRRKHDEQHSKESNDSRDAAPQRLLKPTGRSTATGHMTQLALDFVPGEQDVVCGRGKKCYTHRGNSKFRELVMTFLDEYSSARTKVDKSAVLTKVVEEVRLRSPHGGFVKQDADGVWHEVGDFLAREKTSQAFRDALHDRYKSSNVSKKKRRQEEQSKVPSKSKGQHSTDYDVSSRLERLSNEVMLGRKYKLRAYNCGLHFGFAEGIDNIDDFNRSNYEMLTRLNRIPQPKDSSSSARQYGPQRTPYRTSYQRTFPDPLFGSSTSATLPPLPPINSIGEDRLSADRDFDRRSIRQFSFASAPESSSIEPIVPFGQQMDGISFHQSLPNIHYQQQDEESDPFDDESLHQSMPNITLHQHAMPEPDKMTGGKSMEPIPFHKINLKGRLSEADAAKKPSADECISGASSSSVRLGRDIVECLDKLTCHSITDGNMFEPIPLTPRQEQEIASRRYQMKASGELSSDSVPSGDAEPMDESERIDEFAEG